MNNEDNKIPEQHIFLIASGGGDRKYTIEIPKQPVALYRIKRIINYLGRHKEYAAGRMKPDDIIAYFRMNGVACSRKHDVKIMYLHPHQHVALRDLKTDNALQIIAEVIAEFYKIPIEDLSSRCRKPKYIMYKEMFCYIAITRYKKVYLREVAKFLGLKNHATVIHHYNKVKNWIESGDYASVLNDEHEIDRLLSLRLIGDEENSEKIETQL